MVNLQRTATYAYESCRHRSFWHEMGPVDGPQMFFLHGWGGIGLAWINQLIHFSERGWRCIAPDMRGYGGSTVHKDPTNYTTREIVSDMVELHEALGRRPAIWVGHDWGSPVVWALAAHHPARCRGIVNMCVPYIPDGFGLRNLVSFVDRHIYPIDIYPYGQWDYIHFYQNHSAQSASDFESDVSATLLFLYRRGRPTDRGKPADLASVTARGGWFGSTHRAPLLRRDPTVLSPDYFSALLAAFKQTGFSPGNSWYLNDELNLKYATESPHQCLLGLPVLFLHAEYDWICETVESEFSEPMRVYIPHLTERKIPAGHWIVQEQPEAVNQAIQQWLKANSLIPGS